MQNWSHGKFAKMQHIKKRLMEDFFVHLLIYITQEQNQTALIFLCTAVFSETLIKTQRGESYGGALALL